METKFSPANAVVKLCMKGMAQEDGGNRGAAAEIFMQAWKEATDDFERFIAAYHFGRVQQNPAEKLEWTEKSLQCARAINDGNVKSAYSTLYRTIAECQRELGDQESAKRQEELAKSFEGPPTDQGPFYHGTKADLSVGDLLTPGGNSNYQDGLKMNHIYFAANLDGAGLAAALAAGDGKERVYRVEPTGEFENDPNVTDKKFPGNLTRSYRSKEPLRIIGEETEWTALPLAQLQRMREGSAKKSGEIIN
ncbi:hypothetical protein NCCP2050_18220 [Planococcus sp. NCCP-2050]|nr:hypothetical protein NCCP2050_18220 [Planococcus sp. NCCP-2050]